MSDKLLHNRLDSLFADLEEINELPTPIRDTTGAEGWTFSCDLEQRYTDCSPEVSSILGIPPAAFVGEALLHFALTGTAHKDLEALLDQDDFPAEIELSFRSAQGELVIGKLHLNKTASDNGSEYGYSGFVRVVDRQPGGQAPTSRDGSGETSSESTPPDIEDILPASPTHLETPAGELWPPAVDGDQPDGPETPSVASAPGDTLPLEIPPAADEPPEGLETGFEQGTPAVVEPDFSLDEDAQDDFPGFKTLPALSGTFPDAAPDAFSTHFEFDDAGEFEPEEPLHIVDAAQPGDGQPDNTVWSEEPVLEVSDAEPVDTAEFPSQDDPWMQPLDPAELQDQTPPGMAAENASILEEAAEEAATAKAAPEKAIDDLQPPEFDEFENAGGKTRPFDHLDTMIAELPHAISGPQSPDETVSGEGRDDLTQSLPSPRGTGILRLSEANLKSGTDRDPAVLTVPIHLQERSLGLLEIIDGTPFREWSEDDRRLVEEIADQLSLALENARLFAQTQKALDETETQAQRLARLNEMSEVLSRASHLDEVFAAAGRKTAAVIPSDRVSLALAETEDGQDFYVRALHDESGPAATNGSLPLETAAIEIAIRKRQLVNLPGGREDTAGELAAVMVAPLLASGKLIGTINVGKKSAGEYGRQDENLLLQVASLLASTIEGRRLFEQTEQALSETEALFQASAELNAVQTYDDILAILRRYTIVGNQARNASVFLFDRPWQGEDIPTWQVRIAQWGIFPSTRHPQRLPLSEWKAASEILHQEVPTIIPEIRAHPDLWADDSPLKAELGSAKSALLVPLNVGRQWIGYIFTCYTEPRDFPGVNIRRLTSLAGQAAVAIENLRLFEETMSRARQLQTAAEIARDASETLAVEELLNRAVNLIAVRFGFYHTSIYLLDEDGENAVIWASAGETGPGTHLRNRTFAVGSKSVIGYVTQSGPLVLNDVRQSPIYEPNPDLPDTRAELGIPLKVGERIIGALDVQSTQENPFSPDDVAVLQTLADQIAVAVDNARSYELAQEAIQEARQRLQELSTLYNVSQSFASAPLEIAEIANLVARQFVKLLRVPECAVSILDDTQKSLRILVALRLDSDGEFIDLADVGKVIPVAEYPGARKTLDALSPLAVTLSSPDADPALQAKLIRDGYASRVLIPLAAKGQPIGMIEVKSQADERLTTPGELNLAMTLANQAAVALENASLYFEQRQTAEQLREVDTLKTQFLANMSHELRTPLNSIIGFSRVILKGIDGPVTNLQEQDLTAIYNAGQHLLGLINDILDLSKIEAGKMELSFEIISLVDLINSVMSTAVGLVKHKPIQLVKDLPKDLPPVNVDPLRIRQVLLNLLSNAAKFTEEGTITVSASLQEDEDGSPPQILVRVIDTGPGISPEDQQKLFQPFTQVDASPTRKTGGSGLGLSISLHLIEMHGGQIGVESEQDKGSTFYFTLNTVDPAELDGHIPRPISYIRQTGPLPALAERETVRSPDAKKTGELTLPERAGGKAEPEAQLKEEEEDLAVEAVLQREASDDPLILAIDKDPQIIGLYERYLQPSGYQVIPASDADQALVFARANRPVLITLDVMASSYDGWQLLKDLKADQQTRDIPVIVCSILDEREKAQVLGASDYLVKPILETDLIDAVTRLVRPLSPASPMEGEDRQPTSVLIVDQDPADIRVLEMLLHDNGYFEVSEAADGRQALEAILTEKPDVVVLNHLLPDMDAVTFLRTIRANPTTRSLPVILLTETELPTVIKQQLARNCQAIFHKAKINPEALMTSLLDAAA